MLILMLILIPFLFLFTMQEWNMSIAISSFANLRAYVRQGNVRHNTTLDSFAVVREKIGEKYPKNRFPLYITQITILIIICLLC
jgi:hypothetical protein